MFTILHRIYISLLKMKKLKESEMETENSQENVEKRRKEEEFKKQKLLCCYLRVNWIFNFT